MFLIIGYSEETTIDHFRSFLTDAKTEYQFLNLSTLKNFREISLDVNSNNLIISIDEEVFNFNEYSAFYCRYFFTDLGFPERNSVFFKVLSYISAYLQFCDQLVINRPSAASANANKFLQLIQLKDCGFCVPYTLISNVASKVKENVNPNGAWVSKSCSSIRTISNVLDEELYFNLKKLKICPSMFQERALGYDVRVHVVGDKIIALKIESQNLDYRFPSKDLEPNKYSPIDIPVSIKTKCIDYCKNEALLFGGFDFKVNPENDEWYIFEVNPMPGYDFFDARLNCRISKALLELLQSEPEEILSIDLGDDSPLISKNRRPRSSMF